MAIGLVSQSFPPKSNFTVKDIPNLSGKVAIVTGANTGIGKETAKALLEHDCKVYIACRSAEKAKAAIEDLKASTGKSDLHFLQLDLGDIKKAKQAAEEFLKLESELHLLFNNAGVMTPPNGSKSSDGFELQWGTNVLGHFVFTETLLPLLKSTAKQSSPNSIRIVTTSSSAHTFAPKGGINFEDQFIGGKGGFLVYGQSKIGNIFIANYWAKKLKSDGILSFSLNPGNIKTELQRHMASIMTMFLNLMLHPVAQGAITQLYGGTSPDLTIENTGAYLVPWARLDVSPRTEVADEALNEKVINLIQKQVDETLAKP